MRPWRVFVSGYGGLIRCFALDADTGLLTQLSDSDGGDGPSFLALSGNGCFLYAVNERTGREGRVRAFRVSTDDGACEPLAEAASGGDGPCHLSLHPGGQWLFVAHYASGHVAMLPVRADGGVEDPVCVCQPGVHAHMALPDATGTRLYVPCLGSDWIAHLSCDAARGLLADAIPPHAAVPAGAGPRHLALAGAHAYVVNELDSTVCAFACDPRTGAFEPLGEPVMTVPPGFIGENFPAHIAVHPEGRFIYASNRRHESIALFRRDPESGLLTPAGHMQDRDIANPRGFALDPGGRFLVAAGQDTGAVAVYAINPEDGSLARRDLAGAGEKPSCVLIAPGGVRS